MTSLQAPPRGYIFDLGDVLFKWSANTTTSIPARRLRDILSTPIWCSYERGEISRNACYEQSARELSLPSSEIIEAFAQARSSLQPDHAIISFLRQVKKDPACRVYAMSNMGREDFEDLETIMDWGLFDRVFISAEVGMRKPDLDFFRHVLDKVDFAGSQLVFVDDKEENVRAAQALGIRGFVFGASTVHSLRQNFESSVARGWRYLFQNAEHSHSITSTGVTFSDNFAKLLILDTLQEQGLIDMTWGSRKTWNFFDGEAVLIPGGIYPDDLDTTALALIVLRPSSTAFIASVLDQMMEYLNGDGNFQVYYNDRFRVDPVVSANVLACFYVFDRGHECKGTLQLLHSMLLNRSYMQGTRYYCSTDCSLGFVGRLLRSSSDPHLQKTLGPLLEARVRERIGLEGSALDVAMRIMNCDQMGIACDDDRRTLLGMQCEDGSWEHGWMYQYGSTKIKIGNRGMTTAMAVAALSPHQSCHWASEKRANLTS